MDWMNWTNTFDVLILFGVQELTMESTMTSSDSQAQQNVVQRNVFAKGFSSFRGMFSRKQQQKSVPAGFVELQEFATHRKSDSSISTSSTELSSTSELEGPL